mmetsp:Transcript_3156/g.7096  ORF Transcript_3156/g.7096 Transcript_3156/m.7096 type:complete len:185 (+) Transcript_3156:73-627(+)|eukprot:CAMPEP_0204278360 /NCGR_PEP_ID=MMETSP0468-20130131/29825_1 /ASSEMBLY_ACC=CAM_ASM_000383 /TAXON_ID=2969 /ORGANISM="Oxyrrhis marina" /LENGTH=184 /DNA_ID=CAMNT_0051255259 /DNA_START=63 /DNA_END=617 /DNA_ORIENTATION=-
MDLSTRIAGLMSGAAERRIRFADDDHITTKPEKPEDSKFVSRLDAFTTAFEAHLAETLGKKKQQPREPSLQIQSCDPDRHCVQHQETRPAALTKDAMESLLAGMPGTFPRPEQPRDKVPEKERDPQPARSWLTVENLVLVGGVLMGYALLRDYLHHKWRCEELRLEAAKAASGSLATTMRSFFQ